MSQWRRVAVDSLGWMVADIRRSLGIYGFWADVHQKLHRSFEDDTPEVFAAKLRSVAAYIEWYAPLYVLNPDLFTAFCYAFAEHAVLDDYYPQLKALVALPALDWLRSYEPPAQPPPPPPPPPPRILRRPWARQSRP